MTPDEMAEEIRAIAIREDRQIFFAIISNGPVVEKITWGYVKMRAGRALDLLVDCVGFVKETIK